MPITTIQPGSTNQRPTADLRQGLDKQAGTPTAQEFSAILHKQNLLAAEQGLDHHILAAKSDTAPSTVAPAENGLLRLGEINASTPSVSHLLSNHPTLQGKCWDIIFAEINQGKEFTNMRQGTVVSMDPVSMELTWTDSPSRAAGNHADAVQSAVQGESSASQSSSANNNPIDSAKSDNNAPIPLGRIDADHPTLSHLLKDNPKFRDQTWDIIFSAINRTKPYDSLRPGCQVNINPQNLELSFEGNDGKAPSAQPMVKNADLPPETVNPEISEEQRTFSEKLVESVKSYLGRPYRAIDCYGLVVQGLKNQGVQYYGEGGLVQHLERLAANQGLPANAYMNGEGLIEIAGNKVYDESFVRIKNAAQHSSKVMEQLEPLLQEGMLLSFSTPTRGHTGVIAQRDGQWTYVNSGVIDNQVDGGRTARRVGEETLAKEIENWFVLAKKKGTSLKVSAGVFDTQKLKATGSMVANNHPSEDGVI